MEHVAFFFLGVAVMMAVLIVKDILEARKRIRILRQEIQAIEQQIEHKRRSQCNET